MSNHPSTITVDSVQYVRADSAGAPIYDGDLPGTVFVRTVTMYYVGRIIEEVDGYIVLGDASWVADTGRFGEALATGTLNEVERFPNPVWVNTGAIVDITAWHHPLPIESK